MGVQVTNGAAIACSMGLSPGILSVTPSARLNVGRQPAATIVDNAPAVNISPFGMCNSPANPAVQAATAAKSGVFTPAPCVPVIPAPWTPGSPSVRIGGKPALTSACTCSCQWGGMISITSPGQATVQTA